MIVASDSGLRVARRRSSSSSEMPAPAAARVSSAPSSKIHARVQSGRRSATSSKTFLFLALSRNTPTALESPRIHSTCSAEEVS